MSHERDKPQSDFVQPGPDVEPMSWSLMGRLFGVPLIIISVIVGVAIMVVLLFGSQTTPERESMEQLLAKLEGSTGTRTAGLLPPQEKELWQGAVEIAMRLERKSDEMTEAELGSVTARLVALSEDGLANVENLPDNVPADERSAQLDVRSRRLGWVITALGRTDRPEAVTTLIKIVRSGREPFRMLAISALAEMHGAVNLEAAIDPLVDVIAEGGSTESQVVACHVLGLIAEKNDPRVIDALAQARLSDKSDVSWNAALALARLGSDKGKSILLDLLDRDYLEHEAEYVTEAGGTTRRYPLPPQRVDLTLMASMEAVSHLEDAELWSMVEALSKDRSAQVKAKAVEILETRD